MLAAHGLLLLVTVDLTVILLLLNMTYYTVAYYHAIPESLLALSLGLALFEGFAAWLLYGELVWTKEHGAVKGIAIAESETVVVKGGPRTRL